MPQDDPRPPRAGAEGDPVRRDTMAPGADGSARSDTDAAGDVTVGSPGSAPVDPAPHATRVVDERHRRRLRRWAIGSGVLVGLVTGGVASSYTSVFAARVVEVEGEARLGPHEVLRIAGVRRGTNVVHLDEGVIEARLEEEPWIRDATVRADLPTTIRIDIDERTAVLVVADAGEARLVADDGTLLSTAPPGTGLPEFVAQPGTTPSIAELRSAAEVTGAIPLPLRTRISSVSVDDAGEVSLEIDDGVSVRFGTPHEAAAKAQALRAILGYAGRAAETVLTVDVSAPAAATATFEGAYRPVAGPDPSADVNARREDRGERDGDPPESSRP